MCFFLLKKTFVSLFLEGFYKKVAIFELKLSVVLL